MWALSTIFLDNTNVPLVRQEVTVLLKGCLALTCVPLGFTARLRPMTSQAFHALLELSVMLVDFLWPMNAKRFDLLMTRIVIMLSYIFVRSVLLATFVRMLDFGNLKAYVVLDTIACSGL